MKRIGRCGLLVAAVAAGLFAACLFLLHHAGAKRASAAPDTTTTNQGTDLLPTATDAVFRDPAPGEKRAFLMGFTSWPYGATEDAVRNTYAFIGAHADVVVEHLDDGVPWTESLRDEPWPKWFEKKMDSRRKLRPAGTKLLLSLTPLNMGRNGLAECSGEGSRPPLPAELKGKAFGDRQLTAAYANYCRRMVEFFRPDYLLTGIESNELLNNQPDQWIGYVAMSRSAQRRLREAFPGLPVSESVTLHKLLERQNPDLEDYRARIREFVEGHDFLGVSFYPLFVGAHREEEFAAALDYLAVFSDKQVAITETGHPAQRVSIRSFQLEFPSDSGEQDTYVQVLLSKAQARRFLLVTYWTARDFDALWQVFPDSVKDLGAIWRDTGLLDESGRARPASITWKGWYDKGR
jgi:hypothetical protein